MEKNRDIRAGILPYHELEDRVTCLMFIVTLSHKKITIAKKIEDHDKTKSAMQSIVLSILLEPKNES